MATKRRKRRRTGKTKPLPRGPKLSAAEKQKRRAFEKALVAMRTHKRMSVDDVIKNLIKRVKAKKKRRVWAAKPGR